MVELICFYVNFIIYVIDGNKLYSRVVWDDIGKTCKECIFYSIQYCYNIYLNSSLKKSCMTNDPNWHDSYI